MKKALSQVFARRNHLVLGLISCVLAPLSVYLFWHSLDTMVANQNSTLPVQFYLAIALNFLAIALGAAGFQSVWGKIGLGISGLHTCFVVMWFGAVGGMDNPD